LQQDSGITCNTASVLNPYPEISGNHNGYLSGLTNQQAVERDLDLMEQNQDTAIAALERVDPDIIALQEIDFEAYRSFDRNQQYAVSSALKMPFAAIAINWDKRMDSRTDGSLYTVDLYNEDNLRASFNRYTPDDPLCCASGQSYLFYSIEAEEGGPVVVPQLPADTTTDDDVSE
jgi:hypothetical protein